MVHTPSPHTALLPFLAPNRFAAYRRSSPDEAAALELYVWDRDLSAAFFADIAIIEVAMRHAMHRELVAALGAQWDIQPGNWDDRTMRKLSEARSRLGHRLTPDRLVAELMFGFWLGLLDEGGRATGPGGPRRVKYEGLWRSTLHQAFPGAKHAARATGARASRSWVHGQVAMVAALRNRVAHHEPLINGISLPGQTDASRQAVRITIADAYDVCTTVAGMIDRDLGVWIIQTSTVPRLLAGRPTS